MDLHWQLHGPDLLKEEHPAVKCAHAVLPLLYIERSAALTLYLSGFHICQTVYS